MQPAVSVRRRRRNAADRLRVQSRGSAPCAVNEAQSSAALGDERVTGRQERNREWVFQALHYDDGADLVLLCRVERVGALGDRHGRDTDVGRLLCPARHRHQKACDPHPPRAYNCCHCRKTSLLFTPS